MLSRLLSPAGFVLAGLLFLFPFVGVSCSAPELGELEAIYTGFDLVVDGEPEFDVESPIADRVAAPGTEMPTTGVPFLAAAVLVMLAVGAGCALPARPVVRCVAASGAATLATVLLVVTEMAAHSGLVDSIADSARVLQQNTPEDLDPVIGEDFLSDVVGTRAGFWVLLAVLIVLTAGNLFAARRSRSSRPTMGTSPPG